MERPELQVQSIKQNRPAFAGLHRSKSQIRKVIYAFFAVALEAFNALNASDRRDL
jgi:hypothetical protein